MQRDSEADTCRKYVVPRLYAAGWTDDQISEQRTFTDGRILVVGDVIRRRRPKRADYLLRYTPDKLIAVVEAKTSYDTPGKGIQQAMEYARILNLQFAYSTNGSGILEHDFTTGIETELNDFPKPDDLWKRLQVSIGNPTPDIQGKLLAPTYRVPYKPLRYYEEIAIEKIVHAVLQGRKRILLVMATGTGKTLVAFQVVWKLWSSHWTKNGEVRHPRVLYLSDRDILVDDPKDKDFAPFGDARWRIQGEAVKSREIYFATYQAIARDQNRAGLYKEYPQDFFDLIIVDECHRGSAKDEGNWREILEYFHPAYQLGMTATPKRKDNVDTYKYFGNPVYSYSLKQGIDDGFLAPFKVHRIVTDIDATGWRPPKGEVDRYGRDIPDENYETPDFERVVAFKMRTEAIAQNITKYLTETDRFAKTIVFCVDMEHAEEMRRALVNANADLVREYPDYVARVVSDEGEIGRGHLSQFQDIESKTPVILTTSRLLTTGVDMPTCKNIAIAKVIKSITDFKQTIGRGTRIRDDYGKVFFTILDYTGATNMFADPEFDGEPELLTMEEMDIIGQIVPSTEKTVSSNREAEEEIKGMDQPVGVTDRADTPRKYYVDGGTVEIHTEVVYELDAQGKRVQAVSYTEYTRDKVRTLYTNAADLRSKWGVVDQRRIIMETLDQYGISLEKLAEITKVKDADRFDLLCYIAFNAPLRTRSERAENLRKNKQGFFEKYTPLARAILNEILDKYIEFGAEEFKMPEILKVPPIDKHGNPIEIARVFGGPEELRIAVSGMQTLLYEPE